MSSPASSLAGWNNYLMADELVDPRRHHPPASIAELGTFQGSHNVYNPIEMEAARNYRNPQDYATRSLSAQSSTSQSHWQGLAPMAPNAISQYDHTEQNLNSPMAQPSAPHDVSLPAAGTTSFRRAPVEDQHSRASSVSSSSVSPTFRAIQVTNPTENEPRDDWRLTVPIFNWLSAVLDPKRRPDKSTPAPSGNCLLCDTFCQRPGTLQQHVICQHRMRIARQYIQKRPYNDLLALTFTVLQLHSDRRPGPVENECVHFRYVLKFSPPSGLARSLPMPSPSCARRFMPCATRTDGRGSRANTVACWHRGGPPWRNMLPSVRTTPPRRRRRRVRKQCWNS
ncbi:hypothetical protein BS47DRAFT_1345551 [Hydnum rufescens UP504]|uniref:Uncharacterized protein n=1 Tax=Hydnum rufescens UP504 TaxID=1448309 RepID=A0A9P6AVY8_9AGAM|nr:hypothetical protein BS47DRAFT_1345551 [Hydnum rufescens UP504]